MVCSFCEAHEINIPNMDDIFIINKLIRLCGYYPADFGTTDISELDDQLDTYILDMHIDEEFEGLQGLGGLAQKLFAKNKHEVYPLVFKLVTLALVLPEATTTVERAFFVMTYIKNRLRNRIGDQWLNDSLVASIEKDVLDSIKNDWAF
ncbi:uncharacterized protein LOC111378464 [Olea europaea var. sylvestris]|uniref:uncharacterized protein LOC111378464 n=1 Tax=Olea europaea var. sylvestris TaxID=158386 RepID=UPI000C1D1AE2|nr:uncharacterized protein LOC111378464 [Olea europaea var. sylvestris]